jgi:hypothetical protein
MNNNSTNNLQKKLENILREVENVNNGVNNNSNYPKNNKVNNTNTRKNGTTARNNRTTARKNGTTARNNRTTTRKNGNNTGNNVTTTINNRNNTGNNKTTARNNRTTERRNGNNTGNNVTTTRNNETTTGTNNNNTGTNSVNNNNVMTNNNNVMTNNNNVMTNNNSNKKINLITLNDKQEEVVNTNEYNNSQMNTSKNHFFIGYKLSNNFSNKLKKLQNDLLNYFNKKEKINGVKKVRTFHVRFVYLGYLEYSIALKFYNYLLPLLKAISQKFGPLECDIDRLALKNSSTPKIILKFSNKYLELIKDYLRVNGTDKIFEGGDGSKKSSDSHINILSFSKKDNDTPEIKENLKKFTFNVKPPKFTIHAIDLLKGETIVRRKGQPSKSDEMFVERINDLKLDFTGSKN